MGKSGEKWWKMEGVQGNNDMNWGIQKLGYKNLPRLLALGGSA